jgi:hypothetical protein
MWVESPTQPAIQPVNATRAMPQMRRSCSKPVVNRLGITSNQSLVRSRSTGLAHYLNGETVDCGFGSLAQAVSSIGMNIINTRGDRCRIVLASI